MLAKRIPRHPKVFWTCRKSRWKMQLFRIFWKAGSSFRTNLAFLWLIFLQGRRWISAFSLVLPSYTFPTVSSYVPFVIFLSAYNGCLMWGRFSQQTHSMCVITVCCSRCSCGLTSRKAMRTGGWDGGALSSWQAAGELQRLPALLHPPPSSTSESAPGRFSVIEFPHS